MTNDPITIYNNMKASLALLTLEQKRAKLEELEMKHTALSAELRTVEVMIACVYEEVYHA